MGLDGLVFWPPGNNQSAQRVETQFKNWNESLEPILLSFFHFLKLQQLAHVVNLNAAFQH